MDSENMDFTNNKINSKNLKILENFLKNTCGITSPLYIAKDADTVKFRSLSGTDRKKIFIKHKEQIYHFQNLGFINIDDKYLAETDRVWLNFFSLYEQSHDDYSNIHMVLFKEKLNKWLGWYSTLQASGKQTQYIHVFISHLPDMIEKHNNLGNFTCQGIEKLNDFARIDFFCNTNKHTNEFLLQLLKKLNRNELHRFSIDHKLLIKKTKKNENAKRKYNFFSDNLIV